MSTSLSEFVRAVSDATRARNAFEARQSVRAGMLDVQARVRFRAPDRLAVEYTTYVNPLGDLEEAFGGHAELASADLVGALLAFDGRTTRALTPQAGLALVTPGRRLYEPLPETAVLAEVAFLDDLARDFLVRDGGDTSWAGRPARVVGLRPKRRWVSSVFRAKTFALERAEVTLDLETLFPLHIEFVPEPTAAFAALLGAGERVTIDYADVRFAAPDDAVFAPTFPDGVRVFTEERLALDAAASLPFPLPLDALRACGFAPDLAVAVATVDGDRERGYATLAFRKTTDDGREGILVVRVGNFVSRLMARRRAAAGDHGESVDLAGRTARFLDRRRLLVPPPTSGDAVAPDVETLGLPLLADLAWEHDGVFWVLASEGLHRDELLDAGRAIP